MDELAVAFAMRCDLNGWTYEQGVRAAADLCQEIEDAAEDRANDERVSKEERR